MARGYQQQPIMSFRPILCVGSSTKDMVRDCEVVGSVHRSKKMDAWTLDEPVSPRVSCMGQIKREKVGISTTKPTKLYKLKKMFSTGKSLSREFSSKFDGRHRIISIIDLDPPLPVPKHVNAAASRRGDGVSRLWRRRCRPPLEPLKIQPQQYGRQSQTASV